MELREPDGIADHLLRQERQRDGLTEAEIVSAIDFAHPAAAEQADDAIAIREDRAGAACRPAPADT